MEKRQFWTLIFSLLVIGEGYSLVVVGTVFGRVYVLRAMDFDAMMLEEEKEVVVAHVNSTITDPLYVETNCTEGFDSVIMKPH